MGSPVFSFVKETETVLSLFQDGGVRTYDDSNSAKLRQKRPTETQTGRNFPTLMGRNRRNHRFATHRLWKEPDLSPVWPIAKSKEKDFQWSDDGCCSAEHHPARSSNQPAETQHFCLHSERTGALLPG